MDQNSMLLIAAFVVGWYLVYGKKPQQAQSCNCNHNSQQTQGGNIWEEVRGTKYQPVHPSDIKEGQPPMRQLGFSTGILSGRPCTPHQAINEIQLLQFRRVFGRNPDSNEIAPGVWQWQTDGGGTYTTNTRDGS